MTEKIRCLYCPRKATHYYLSDDGETEYYLCTPCSEAFNAGTEYGESTIALPIGCTPEGENWINEAAPLTYAWLVGRGAANGTTLSYYTGISEELAAKITKKFGTNIKGSRELYASIEKMLRKDYYGPQQEAAWERINITIGKISQRGGQS